MKYLPAFVRASLGSVVVAFIFWAKPSISTIEGGWRKPPFTWSRGVTIGVAGFFVTILLLDVLRQTYSDKEKPARPLGDEELNALLGLSSGKPAPAAVPIPASPTFEELLGELGLDREQWLRLRDLVLEEAYGRHLEIPQDLKEHEVARLVAEYRYSNRRALLDKAAGLLVGSDGDGAMLALDKS